MENNQQKSDVHHQDEVQELPYTPAHVANYFLWRAWSENIEITPMKLIKLVYIAYGWNLAINGTKLFSEEIVAWKYGPVIQSLYHEFKRFGNRAITQDNYAADFNLETGKVEDVPMIIGSDQDTLLVLNAEWEYYKDKTGLELSKITHNADSPWSDAYSDGQGCNNILDDQKIKERSLRAISRMMKSS